MSNVRGKIFCQRCKSPNDLGEDLCGRCGTRLMLLVEPSAARFEGRGVAPGMEEHLLERVTAIENNISRVIDKMERMAELMLKQSRSSYFDHELLDTLIALLGESGVVSRKRLAELWRARRSREAAEAAAEARWDEMREGALAAYDGREAELFTRLVVEGFADFKKRPDASGLRKLERAAALAPDNAPLNTFLGERLYLKGKTAPARDYFTRALEADPESARLRLLLGLARGDEGDVEGARTLLREAAGALSQSFAARCALGLLAGSEGDWKGALAEFKLALAARPIAEAQYLLGLANFRLGRDRTALRHLSKAVGLDQRFGSAFRLLGLVHERLGDPQEAARAFELARANDGAGEGEPRDDSGDAVASAPETGADGLSAAKGRARRRLLSGGEARVAAALVEDAVGEAPAR